jgi:Fe2+ or Zn2+ uptake regulation protein
MKTTEQRLAWALDVCRQVQLRMTPVRRTILSFLALHRTPKSLEAIEQADGVRGRCDATTVYRTLMMFKEARMIRSVGTPRKASYFVLNVPDESNHFLICRQCGQMAELPALQVLTALDKQIMEQRGYTAVYHELEVYGICPDCRAKMPVDTTNPTYGQRGMTVKIGAKPANHKSVW